MNWPTDEVRARAGCVVPSWRRPIVQLLDNGPAPTILPVHPLVPPSEAEVAVFDLLPVVLTLAVGTVALFLFFTRRKAAELQRERDDLQARNEELRSQYAPIMDMDAAVAAAKSELEKTRADQHASEKTWADKRAKLSTEYDDGLTRYEALRKEIGLLEENLEDISYGLYQPHYSFDSSEQYKANLDELRARQKLMVREGLAAKCKMQWQGTG